MSNNSRDLLIKKLREISSQGWIMNRRPGNAGGVGNTLEDLLGIKENNLQLPDIWEWEIKSQRSNTSSLLTLIHMEPLPRSVRFVPSILLPLYGWTHQEAGTKYPQSEMSFRQTINCQKRSDRGFKVEVDRINRKIFVSFDANSVDPRHSDWLKTVSARAGLKELQPQPYWDFDSLQSRLEAKLTNSFYIQAHSKTDQGSEYFNYNKFVIMRDLNFAKFIDCIETGDVLVDFDARTGHNHGTKFRVRQNKKQDFYNDVIIVGS